MIQRAFRLAAACAAIACLAAPVFAAETIPFTADKFKAAQQAGKPILVDIFAAWCPTCRAQEPVIWKLADKPEYKDLIVFEVNFDSQKDVMRSFGALKQSTLIAFKGSKETARSVGDTSEAGIEEIIRSAFWYFEPRQ